MGQVLGGIAAGAAGAGLTVLTGGIAAPLVPALVAGAVAGGTVAATTGVIQGSVTVPTPAPQPSTIPSRPTPAPQPRQQPSSSSRPTSTALPTSLPSSNTPVLTPPTMSLPPRQQPTLGNYGQRLADDMAPVIQDMRHLSTSQQSSNTTATTSSARHWPTQGPSCSLPTIPAPMQASSSRTPLDLDTLGSTTQPTRSTTTSRTTGGVPTQFVEPMRSAAERMGMADMLTPALADTVRIESTWNATARNPRSTATGLFQITRGSWNDQRTWIQNNYDYDIGPHGNSDVEAQTMAGLAYIHRTYGTPERAMQFRRAIEAQDAIMAPEGLQRRASTWIRLGYRHGY